MNYWLTSDTHFGHTNIIQYCNRPFMTAHEMDEVMIENWNALVKPGDIVRHLGDFAWVKSVEAGNRYLKRLNGQIHLIKGNHDSSHIVNKMNFASVKLIEEWRIPPSKVRLLTMCHYPMMMWNGSHRGEWHAHGHCHDLLPITNDRLCIDVGVDSHGYKPVNLDDLTRYMKKRERLWVPLVMKGERRHGVLVDGTPVPREEPKE